MLKGQALMSYGVVSPCEAVFLLLIDIVTHASRIPLLCIAEARCRLNVGWIYSVFFLC